MPTIDNLVAAFCGMGAGLILLGLILYQRRSKKNRVEKLPSSALNPRILLDLRSALFVISVPDADIQYDGRQVLVTLPQSLKDQGRKINEIHNTVVQVLRRGLPVFYAFHDRVVGRGIIMHECAKMVVPEGGIHVPERV